jgi:hypothetical protein
MATGAEPCVLSSWLFRRDTVLSSCKTESVSPGRVPFPKLLHTRTGYIVRVRWRKSFGPRPLRKTLHSSLDSSLSIPLLSKPGHPAGYRVTRSVVRVANRDYPNRMRPRDLPGPSFFLSRSFAFLAFLAPIGNCQTRPSLSTNSIISTPNQQLSAHKTFPSTSHPKLLLAHLHNLRLSLRHGRPRLRQSAKASTQTPSIQLAQNTIPNPLQFRVRAPMARSPRPRRPARTARRLRTNVCGSRTICKMDANPSAVGGRSCCFW